MLRSCVGRAATIVVLVSAGIFANTSSAFAVAPTVTGIGPNNGPVVGGTSVLITGTGFISKSTVKFGSNAATGVSIKSSTSITAISPAGSEIINVSVTNSNGTSASTPYDQFAYDSIPSEPWLGLNGNNSTYLGSVDAFLEHSVVYDRSGPIDWAAGEFLEEKGKATEAAEGLAADISNGMIPVITIEYSGYKGTYESDPKFPTEEKGSNSLKEYVEGFVKSAEVIIKAYPGKSILFEPINEPWGYTTPQYNGAEYANVIAKLLPAANEAHIPLRDIYIGAFGKDCIYKGVKEEECITNGWIPAMYKAQPKLETEIGGWYFHPYGPPSGVEYYDSRGIQSVPLVQDVMTSGQNNIIVSEVGYCAEDVNSGADCDGKIVKNSTLAASDLTEMLNNALPYHRAGWLKALIVYSRNDGGWAMQLPGSELTRQGEALETFANVYGFGWLVQSTPSPSGASEFRLKQSSCVTADSCFAVGRDTNSLGVIVTLGERWNGKEWLVQETPNPSESKESLLSSVSCTSVEACTAVGRDEKTSGIRVPLVERWNGGEWKIQEAVVPVESSESGLNGVSCVSAVSCRAVGYSKNSSGVQEILAESWNGEKWKIDTSPDPIESSAVLSRISCVAGECIAVGAQENSVEHQSPLSERWNGSEWKLEITPKPSGARTASLSDVSCVSPTFCIAAGTSWNGASLYSALIEQWNGLSWKIKESPNKVESPLGFSAINSLYGVSCSSIAKCSAVGYYSFRGTTGTLAEVLKGEKWAVEETPNPTGAYVSMLEGVSCPSALTCFAVGGYWDSAGAPTLPFAEVYE